MNNQPDKADSAQTLRLKAEKSGFKIDDQTLESLKTMSPVAILQMLHELQVHQLELKLQNEELQQTQYELDTIRSRYFDLYDLAPVGYCTLSGQGLILETNLKADMLLGVTRLQLVGRSFHLFILTADQDIFYLYHRKLDNTGEPQDCELRMVKPGGESLFLR